jgi:hypothetical protein
MALDLKKKAINHIGLHRTGSGTNSTAAHLYCAYEDMTIVYY